MDRMLKYLTISFFIVVFIFNFSVVGEQQFSYLAHSFLKGKLYFLEKPLTWNDTALYEGKYYWPLSPFPAVVLMPFVYIFGLFGMFFLQGYLQFFLVIGEFYLIYKIAKSLDYSSDDAWFWAFAFTFSSSFLGVAMWPWSWYFSQVITVVLLFWALYEFLNRKRFFILGVISGLLFLTRLTASFVVIPFLLDILFKEKPNPSQKIKDIVALISPVMLTIILTLSYNFLRFNSLSEFGYRLQNIPDFADKARSLGVFSFIHLPANLYYFLLSPPLPHFKDGLSAVLSTPFVKANPWGMGIFFTSPYFVYLFFLKYKTNILRWLWVGVFVIAMPIFFYYGIGYRQYGYRYSLDFLPVLVVILIISYRKKYHNISPGLKTLIIIFSFINLYLFITMFT